MRGPGLAPEDRREIRIGIMRGWGTRHSGLLTFMLWLYVVLGAAAVAFVVFLAAKVHDVWVEAGGVGDWLGAHGVLLIAAGATVVVFVWAFWSGGQPRRRRRYRRWNL